MNLTKKLYKSKLGSFYEKIYKYLRVSTYCSYFLEKLLSCSYIFVISTTYTYQQKNFSISYICRYILPDTYILCKTLKIKTKLYKTEYLRHSLLAYLKTVLSLIKWKLLRFYLLCR